VRNSVVDLQSSDSDNDAAGGAKVIALTPAQRRKRVETAAARQLMKELAARLGENPAPIPDAVVAQELSMKEQLSQLNDRGTLVKSIAVVVGKQQKRLVTMSYSALNLSQPVGKKKRFYGSEVLKTTNKLAKYYKLYRYDCVEAVVTSSRDSAVEILDPNSTGVPIECEQWDSCDRVYHSMCQLNHHTEGRRFVLLQVLMTLCSTARVDFLLFDHQLQQCQLFQGSKSMKYFWCEPHHDFTAREYKDLFAARNEYFDRHSYYYDKNRGHARDMKGDPEDREQPGLDSPVALLQSYELWEPIFGDDIICDDLSMYSRSKRANLSLRTTLNTATPPPPKRTVQETEGATDGDNNNTTRMSR
jgi:hypothetical protein